MFFFKLLVDSASMFTFSLGFCFSHFVLKVFSFTAEGFTF